MLVLARALPILFWITASPLLAQSTFNAGLNNAGQQSLFGPGASAMARYSQTMVFSMYDGFEPGDNNNAWDIYARDWSTGLVQRASVSVAGGQPDQDCWGPCVSGDGRYVGFISPATNLVANDNNARWDAFVRDRVTGTTERVSVDWQGGELADYTRTVRVSMDGQLAVFDYQGPNALQGGSPGGTRVLYARDRAAGTTVAVSASNAGAFPNDNTGWDYNDFAVSDDDRYVVFSSRASNLVAGDVNAQSDIFLKDLQSGLLTLVSTNASGVQGTHHSFWPSISADGRYIAFTSYAQNMLPAHPVFYYEVFRKDLTSGAVDLVTPSFSGGSIDGVCGETAISMDGRWVAFRSYATNLIYGDTNGVLDVFVRDMLLQKTTLESLRAANPQVSRAAG